jgi:hypothetical protein
MISREERDGRIWDVLSNERDILTPDELAVLQRRNRQALETLAYESELSDKITNKIISSGEARLRRDQGA